jgi:hypothetical protein
MGLRGRYRFWGYSAGRALAARKPIAAAMTSASDTNTS